MGIQNNLFAWCFYFFFFLSDVGVDEWAPICPNRIWGWGYHKTLEITIYRQQRLDHYHTKCTVTIRDLLIRARTRSIGNEFQGPNLSEYPGMWLKAVMESRGTFTLGQNFKMEPPRYSAYGITMKSRKKKTGIKEVQRERGSLARSSIVFICFKLWTAGWILFVLGAISCWDANNLKHSKYHKSWQEDYVRHPRVVPQSCTQNCRLILVHYFHISKFRTIYRRTQDVRKICCLLGCDTV